MKRRLIALLTGLLIIVPGVLQAVNITSPQDFTPRGAIVTGDLQLMSKLKNIIEPMVRKDVDAMDETQSDEKKAKLLINKFLNGDQFFVSFEAPESIVISVQVTDAEWTTFMTGGTKSTHGATDIYSDESTFFVKLGNWMLVSPSSDAVNKAIDLAEGTLTDSLSKNEKYTDFVKSYLTPRSFSMTADIKNLATVIGPMLRGELDSSEEKAFTTIMDLLALVDFEGGSLAETDAGYKFNVKVKGNAEKLLEQDLKFNPSGDFTPSLYRKLPNLKPIYFGEGNNMKAEYAETKKIMDKLYADFGMPTSEEGFAQIKEATGIDLLSIYNIFDKQYVTALQYEDGKVIPYFTMMGDVTNTKEEAKKFATSIVDAFKKLLEGEGAPKEIYSFTTNGDLTYFTLDLSKSADFNGPPLPKFVITLGVTTDNLFVFSNYEGIEKAEKQTGFAFDYSVTPCASVSYLNARNVWGWLDSALEWVDSVASESDRVPLEFYQGYYSLLDSIYSWKDMYVVTTSTASDALVTGEIKIDSAKHQSYSGLMTSYKTSDQDKDGVSDYDEKFLYNTPMSVSDTNKNGTSDIEELKQGMNPAGKGQLFKDVAPGAYYTSDTAFLYQRHAIAGYPDGTFKPGNMVNRAEFVTMVMKSFDKSTSEALGLGSLNMNSDFEPFIDVKNGDWFQSSVAKAYAAGFISGSTDKQGNLIFRPGDNITRAEAMGILNKASKVLKKTNSATSCKSITFNDVSDKDWFCGAVANGYDHGLTKGKSKGQFKPFDNLTRAEAAVMISRAIEKDVAAMGKETEEDLVDPTESLGNLLMPMLR